MIGRFGRLINFAETERRRWSVWLSVFGRGGAGLFVGGEDTGNGEGAAGERNFEAALYFGASQGL